MRCLMCGREFGFGSFRDMMAGDDLLCTECRGSWERKNIRFELDHVPAEASYIYNDAFSDCLIQYKECMDEALKDVFLAKTGRKLKRKYRGYVLVPMPSSEEKLRERGFNHLEKMYESLQMPMAELFVKQSSEVQKGHSAKERRAMENLIALKPGTEIPEKILLVDDTITTGSTLRGALKALKGHDSIVRIYAVSVNKLWIR